MPDDRAPYTGAGELSDALRQCLLSLLAGTVLPCADVAAAGLRTAGLASRTPAGAWELTADGAALARRLRAGLGTTGT